MKVTFIGDDNGHGPEELQMFGMSFAKNVATDVSGLAPALKNKLRGNGHFRFEEVCAEGDDEKAERKRLIAEALEDYGVKIHHKTGLDKIREALEDLRFQNADD